VCSFRGAPWHPVPAELLEIPSQRVHKAALVAVQLMQTTWVLFHLLVALDNVIDGTVEGHKLRGITGYNLGQNLGGRRDLIITALVLY
jgi:hypothetical protein